MKLHQNISYPEFLSLLLDYFNEIRISHEMSAEHLGQYAYCFYATRQFCLIEGTNEFITWACLSDENEKLWLDAEECLFNPLGVNSGNNLWIIDARVEKHKVSSFIKRWKSQYLGRFDGFKCMLLNNDRGQYLREVRFGKDRQKGCQGN